MSPKTAVCKLFGPHAVFLSSIVISQAGPKTNDVPGVLPGRQVERLGRKCCRNCLPVTASLLLSHLIYSIPVYPLKYPRSSAGTGSSTTRNHPMAALFVLGTQIQAQKPALSCQMVHGQTNDNGRGLIGRPFWTVLCLLIAGVLSAGAVPTALVMQSFNTTLPSLDLQIDLHDGSGIRTQATGPI